MMSAPLFCCHIDTPPAGDCGNYALYDIRWGPTPDDYTHSCAAHLETMIAEEDQPVTVSRLFAKGTFN